MADRTFLRWGGAAAVIGGVLALVGNALHPRWTDVEDVELYRNIADSGVWKADHLLLVVALVLTVAGTVAIARSLHDGAGDTLARYGLLATVVGGAIALANISVDGYAARIAAENFAGASAQDQVGAFWASNAIDHISTAMFNVWTMVLLGISPLLLGMAALRSKRYPAWLAWAATAGGAVCTVVGFWGLGTSDQDMLVIPFVVGSVLVTLWILGAGWMLWQQPEPEPAAARGEALAA
jgi:hypothetical protein